MIECTIMVPFSSYVTPGSGFGMVGYNFMIIDEHIWEYEIPYIHSDMIFLAARRRYIARTVDC